MSRVPIPEPVPPHNEWQTWNPAEEKVKIISDRISEQKHKSNGQAIFYTKYPITEILVAL